MKKRGDISLWFLLEFIVAFSVVYMAVNVSVAYAQGTIYEKLNLAKDLAMQLNTIAGISGNAYIVNKNLHDYSFYFIDNRIEVSDSNDLVKGIYYFVKTEESDINIRLIKPKQIVISKIDGEITISEEIPKFEYDEQSNFR